MITYSLNSKNSPSVAAVKSTKNHLVDALSIQTPSPSQTITWPNSNVSVSVKRDDLIHPVISGNKWRKLWPTLSLAVLSGHRRLLSFGGGYSNHLHALAYACHKLSLHCVCVVRGDYRKNFTPMLRDILQWGATVEFVDKITYQRRQDKTYLDDLAQKHNVDAVIPEGGSASSGLDGVGEIVDELAESSMLGTLILPVGSGGTLAGLIKHSLEQRIDLKLIGVNALKMGPGASRMIHDLYPDAKHADNWTLDNDSHHGGYAKRTKALDDFISMFFEHTGIALDPVYNAKSFYAVDQMLRLGFNDSNEHLCLLQTGGNQGSR